jgi:hypothetical protein
MDWWLEAVTDSPWLVVLVMMGCVALLAGTKLGITLLYARVLGAPPDVEAEHGSEDADDARVDRIAGHR